MTDKMTTVAMGVSCAVLMLVGWLAMWTIHSLQYATDRVTHTQEVVVRLERLKSEIREAETTGRGYLLSPSETLRTAFDRSRQAIAERLADLKRLVGDNPEQVRRLIEIEPHIDGRIAALKAAMDAAESGRIDEAGLDLVIENGIAAMAPVVSGFQALSEHERTLFRARSARAEGRLQWVYIAIGGGFFLSLALLIWPITQLRAEIREREQARRRLEESAGRIQDLYDNAPCGYLSLNASGKVTAANQTLRRWLGLEKAGTGDWTLDALCKPESRERILGWLQSLNTETVGPEIEAEFLRRDGTQLPVWLTAAKASGGDGEWRITVVDGTERKRAESVLAAARAQAESIVNTVRQPLLVLTQDLRVMSANRSFHAMFETDDAGVIGRRFAEIDDGVWRVPELLRALEDIVPKHTSLENFEISLNRPGKGRRVFELNARKLFRPGNNTTMTLLAIEDITVQKEVDDVHRQFRALFESLPGRYLVLTPDLMIVAASDAYLAITGKKRQEITGRTIFEVFPDNPADAQATGVASLKASFNRVLQTGTTDTMPVLRYDVTRADGVFEERHWSPVNSPVFGADKKIEYIIHRVEDVTEFVKTRRFGSDDGTPENPGHDQIETEMLAHSRELGAANQQLRALNEELEAFSYSVSHDLRAPLRHIAGFSEMLSNHAEATLDAKGKRYLKTIEDSANRMGTLIDDLLMFSRMSRTEMRRQKVLLGELVASVQESLKPETNGRAIHWEIEELPAVDGDAAMLRQVFANLLGNAVKYSRKQAEARIHVSATNAAGGMVEVRVRDNGAGFDMKYAPKLFGVFQRLHSATEFEGTGVGLAIVRRIVQRHGGHIWAESAPGAGATFYLTLPRAQAAESVS